MMEREVIVRVVELNLGRLRLMIFSKSPRVEGRGLRSSPSPSPSPSLRQEKRLVFSYRVRVHHETRLDVDTAVPTWLPRPPDACNDDWTKLTIGTALLFNLSYSGIPDSSGLCSIVDRRIMAMHVLSLIYEHQ